MQAVLHLIRVEEEYSKCVVLLGKISDMRGREYIMASRFAQYGPCSSQGRMKRDISALGEGTTPL